MAGSSPPARPSRYPRQSSHFSSPDRAPVAVFLSPNRNSELNHQQALAEAAAEHTRIRAKADYTLKIYLHEEEEQRFVDLQRRTTELQEKERQRIEREKAARAEQERLRALQRESIPPLSPAPVPPKPPAVQPQHEKATPSQQQPDPSNQNQKAAPATTANGTTTPQSSTPAPSGAVKTGLDDKPTPAARSKSTVNPFAGASSQQASAAGEAVPVHTSKPQPNGAAATAQPAQKTFTDASIDPVKQRYIQIHKNLKLLRIGIVEQAKTNKPLKDIAGDLRREIRKCVGQISMDRANNKMVMAKLLKAVKDGLANAAGSQLIDPSAFVSGPREPAQEAEHNAEMPSLFLYVLNILAKCMINQFINECGTITKAADPIGVAAAQLFADPMFHWRGQTLIDILIAKFYVVCPVLFGSKGSDFTEQGRDRVGWKRDGTGWISEGLHQDRMFGLGAGYASIALRDFSKSTKTNPWPVRHYWESFAKIVNTPPKEISGTQCLVLKAMIEHYETRFLTFYGSAAVAALRIALVEFPARARAAGQTGSQVQFLAVHAQVLAKTTGLHLE